MPVKAQLNRERKGFLRTGGKRALGTARSHARMESAAPIPSPPGEAACIHRLSPDVDCTAMERINCQHGICIGLKKKGYLRR